MTGCRSKTKTKQTKSTEMASHVTNWKCQSRPSIRFNLHPDFKLCHLILFITWLTYMVSFLDKKPLSEVVPENDSKISINKFP